MKPFSYAALVAYGNSCLKARQDTTNSCLPTPSVSESAPIQNSFGALDNSVQLNTYNNDVAVSGASAFSTQETPAPLYPLQTQSISEQLRHNARNWSTPRDIIFNVIAQKPKVFEERRLIKRDGCYFVQERNGREVPVGYLKATEKTVVNPQEDGSFDCMLCSLLENGQTESRKEQFPRLDLLRNRIMPHLWKFHPNIDCPAEYITAAFYEELRDGDDVTTLTLPAHSGWNCEEEQCTFVSAETMIPQLADYYADDIPMRKIPETNLDLAAAAQKLASIFPDNAGLKLLLTASTASLLLPFFPEEGYQPDRILLMRPESEPVAKVATVCLSNQDYFSTTTCSLSECKTVLQRVLNNVWDGMCVFCDLSYVENRSQRMAGMDVLLQDLRCGQGINEIARHMIAVLSNNPGIYSSEMPLLFINLSGCPSVNGLGYLQQAIGDFHSALIHVLSTSNPKHNFVTNAVRQLKEQVDEATMAEMSGTERILRTTLCIMEFYGVFGSEDIAAICDALNRGDSDAFDSNLVVVNEFRMVFSAMIEDNTFAVANQFEPPYYTGCEKSVVLDRDYVNLNEAVLNKVVAHMETTKRRNVVLSALDAAGKLHANNNYKRLLDIETAPGVVETVNLYSVPRAFLTPSCQAKLKAVRYADRLFDRAHFPSGFLPLVCVDEKAAGRVIDENSDEDDNLYVSGQTRSGKTFLLVQQAMIRAASGQQLIIFDQSGAFSSHELRKHLSDKLVESAFSFWDIGQEGLPVDILSLDHCHTLREKKDRLFSVFSVAGRISGEVMGKLLRSRLTKIAKAIEAGEIHTLSDTLQFFDEDDPDQAEIRTRLEEAFEDLDGLPVYQRDWGAFFGTQKPIVVVSTADDGIRKSAQHIDALLANLYAWKQYNQRDRFTVVLDEVEDFCLEKEGSVSTILRKGGKHRLSMMLASQEFSAEKDLLGKIIGNCATLAVFRPKDNNISELAKQLNVDRQQLAALEQREMLVVGPLYSQRRGRNIRTSVSGMAFPATEYPAVQALIAPTAGQLPE